MGEHQKQPEPIVNYLKVSELLLSNAISNKDQIADQLQNTIGKKDQEILGPDISQQIVEYAINSSDQDELDINEIMRKFDITNDEAHRTTLQKLLLQTGFFVTKQADSADILTYSSPDLQNIFRYLCNSNFDPGSINFDFKDYSVKPRVLWHIPGQTAMIGPIDAEDAQTLHRFYILERWKRFTDIFVGQTTKTLKKLVSSNSSTYDELDLSNRLNKMYGIFGGKNGKPGEIGELQGGSFIYRLSRNSRKIISHDQKLISQIENVSGSTFQPYYLTEISWFKSPYAQEKHMGAGIRQILAREHHPTQNQEIKMRNPFPKNDTKVDNKNYIFVAFILPENMDSKHVANSVGMEYAGEIDRTEDGIPEHVEVWVLNRDKLNQRIFEDMTTTHSPQST